MSKRRMTAEGRAKIFKALADERRVDIVDSLMKHGSQCGTQLAEQLDISLALLCHHWEVLVDAGVVKKERVGQLRMCTLDAERLREATGAWEEPAAPEKKAASAKKKAAPAKKKAGPAKKKAGAVKNPSAGKKTAVKKQRSSPT